MRWTSRDSTLPLEYIETWSYEHLDAASNANHRTGTLTDSEVSDWLDRKVSVISFGTDLRACVLAQMIILDRHTLQCDRWSRHTMPVRGGSSADQIS